MSKSDTAPAAYIAQTRLTNDRTGKTYPAGTVIRPGDFNKTTLNRWREIGRIAPAEE
jgi:hypothetical protein